MHWSLTCVTGWLRMSIIHFVSTKKSDLPTKANDDHLIIFSSDGLQ